MRGSWIRLEDRGLPAFLVWLPFLFSADVRIVEDDHPLAAPGADRLLGWFGEPMPECLSRTDKEGEYIWEKDGSVMVFVPLGPFLMGSEHGDSDESPMHEVLLEGFYIDKHETTWRQWRLSGLPMPRAPFWGTDDRQPVVNVNWKQAKSFLAWAGKRLPTEAEWEKAARGADGRVFPWGDEPPTPERCVTKAHPMAKQSTAPVDSCAAGASPYGVLNMAGNVYEWCEDWYEAGFYEHSPARHPRNLTGGRFRVLRGGSFIHGDAHQRAAYRYRLLPLDRTPYIGFRGVVSLRPPLPRPLVEP